MSHHRFLRRKILHSTVEFEFMGSRFTYDWDDGTHSVYSVEREEYVPDAEALFGEDFLYALSVIATSNSKFEFANEASAPDVRGSGDASGREGSS